MKVRVVSRSGRDMDSFEFSGVTTVGQFKAQFAKRHPKFYVTRQYFTLGEGDAQVRLTDPDKTLSEYGVKEGTTLVFKDLGAQISWRTVFLVEYFGPILIHSIFYFFPQAIYGQDIPESKRHPVAKLGFYAVLFHYIKREFESVFVHRFSSETMPWFNIIKNSSHYWILSGLFLAYPLYHPQYTNSMSSTAVYAGLAVFLLSELGNGWAHIVLMNLRPAGTRTRGIPKGGLFNIVSCANYTYECLAWLAFAYFTRMATAYLFLLVSFAQIAEWALKKHKRYKQEFPDYPRGRKALVPFLL